MLLKPGADTDETENKLQVLRNALERLDFSSLRAAFPELAENHRDDIRLLEGQGDRLKLMINDKVIDLSEFYKT